MGFLDFIDFTQKKKLPFSGLEDRLSIHLPILNTKKLMRDNLVIMYLKGNFHIQCL